MIPTIGAPKPKEYQLSKEQLSELSYVATQRTAALEVGNFWDKRLEAFMAGIRQLLSIPAEDDVNWNDAFNKGKIFATKKPAPPSVAKKEEGNHDSNSQKV